ncbi:MAG: hypothetical protein WCE51_16600 [Chthoniobacterales bacterium]|jgi:hypothetical protein
MFAFSEIFCDRNSQPRANRGNPPPWGNASLWTRLAGAALGLIDSKNYGELLDRPLQNWTSQIAPSCLPSWNKTVFFDNLPLEITCLKCGKRINETVAWLKADRRECPFCNALIDTTEFRRGVDEATNRTHEMLQNLQSSLKTIKIAIKI